MDSAYSSFLRICCIHCILVTAGSYRLPAVTLLPVMVRFLCLHSEVAIMGIHADGAHVQDTLARWTLKG